MRYTLRTLLIVVAFANLTLAFCRSSDSAEDAAIPEPVATLVPMLIKWAKDGTSLPGLPRTNENELEDPNGFPDTSGVQSNLKKRSPKFIYIAWNARERFGPDRFNYKYEISTGTLSTVDASDLPAISRRDFSIAEGARFGATQLDDGTLTVSMSMGWGGAKVQFRRTPKGFEAFKITDRRIS